MHAQTGKRTAESAQHTYSAKTKEKSKINKCDECNAFHSPVCAAVRASVCALFVANISRRIQTRNSSSSSRAVAPLLSMARTTTDEAQTENEWQKCEQERMRQRNARQPSHSIMLDAQNNERTIFFGIVRPRIVVYTQ